MPEEVRALIRTMSREIPLWGAPRIHGELLKPGIDLGETSVSKYLVRRHKPPSQTWRTFLDNHVKTMVPILPKWDIYLTQVDAADHYQLWSASSADA